MFGIPNVVAMLCFLAHLLIGSHSLMPVAFFWLLADPNNSEWVPRLPAMHASTLGRGIPGKHGHALGSAKVRAKLELLALLRTKDVATIEARHAWMRRWLYTLSTRCRTMQAKDLCCLHVLQRARRISAAIRKFRLFERGRSSIAAQKKRTYRESGRARRVALRAASFRNNLTGRGAAQLWAEFRAVRESGGVEWKRLQRLGREAAGRRSTRHVSSFGTLRRRIDGRRVATTQLLHARWKHMVAKSKASVVSHVAAGAASLSADRGMRRAGAAPYQRPLPSNVSILCGCVKRRHSTELRCSSGKRARGRSWISSRTPWGATAAAQPKNGAHLKGRPR